MQPLSHALRASLAGIAPLALAHLAPPALAQVEPAFQIDYRTPGSPLQRPQALVAAPDGGTVTAFVAASTVGAQTVLLTIHRYSRDGDRLWTQLVPTSICTSSSCLGSFNVGAAVDAQGNTYVVHRGVGANRLLKVSGAGTLLFDIAIPNSADVTGALVTLDSLGRPVVGGTWMGPNLFPFAVAYGFDASGNLRFEVGRTEVTEVLGIEMGPFDEVALYGRTDYPGLGFGSYRGSILVFDADLGTQLWRQELSSNGFTPASGTGPVWFEEVEDVEFDAAGNLYAFTNADSGTATVTAGLRGFALSAFDRSGTALFRTTVESLLRTRGLRIAVDGSGAAYVAGMQGPTGGTSLNPADLSLWKFDAAGVEQWRARDTIDYPGASRATAVGVTAEGDVFVTGRHGDAGVGVDLLVDAAAGSVLWRSERAGEIGAIDHDHFVRDDVLGDVDGQVWRQRQASDRIALARFVTGDVLGTQFCGPAVPNSTGASATIVALGSDLASGDDLTLRLAGLPPGALALIVNSQTTAVVPMAGGGQGTLCLGGTIGRFNRPGELRQARADGGTSLRVPTASLPEGGAVVPATAGAVWHFQGWYRDLTPAPTSNLTDAVSVTFR